MDARRNWHKIFGFHFIEHLVYLFIYMMSIPQKLTVLGKIRDAFRIYLDKRLPAVKHYRNTKKTIEEGMRFLSSIELAEIASIEGQFAAMKELQTADGWVQKIKAGVEHLSKTRGNEDQSFSGTYVAETSHMFINLMKSITKLTRQSNKITESILEEFVGSRVLDFSAFERARSAFLETGNYVLYAKYAQSTINAVWFSARPDAYKIMRFIEKDKTDALVDNRPVRKVRVIASNPEMRTFGLMGSTEPTSLAIATDSKIKTLAKLDALCKKRGICAVVFTRVTNTPLDFRFNQLMHRPHQFRPKQVGISPKYMKRMQTIHRADDAKWQFQIIPYGDTDSASFMLLETTDGQLYRRMAPWFVRGMVPRHHLLGLIDRIENKPSRIGMYNRALSKRVIGRMFSPKLTDVDRITKESQLVDPKYIRNEAFILLMKNYDKHAKKIKTSKAFEMFVHSDEMPELLSDFLVRRYKAIKQPCYHQFRPAEAIVDFIFELQYIVRAFSQEMYDQYAKFRPDPCVFKSEFRGAELRETFEEIINAVLQSVITDTKNVYQAMSFKNRLLAA